MRAGMTPALEARLRRPDPIARLKIEAQAELPGADIRQTAAQWNTADSLTGLTVLTDGGVQLAGGATVIAQNPGGAGTYIPGLGAGDAVGVINWFGDEPPNMEITFLTAYLQPRPNSGQPQAVVTWRCQLYQPLYKYRDNTRAFQLTPLCDPVYVSAVGTTAGDVTFDFRAVAQRPRPKAHNDMSLGGPLNGAATFVVISALDLNGKPAANVAWNQDPANLTVLYFNWRTTTATLHANILSTDTTLGLDSMPGNFPYSGYIKIDSETIFFTRIPSIPTLLNITRGQNGTTAASHTAGAAVFLGSHNDIGAGTVAPSLTDPGWLTRQATGGGAVRMTVNTGAFTAATLRFSTTPVNLGAAPTAPVELSGRAEVPNGATATFQVLKTGGVVGNPGDWLTYTDGMLTNDPSFGGLLTAAQTYKMQCILTPNAAGNAAPTLRALGARQVTRIDLSNVAQIKSGQWEFDALTLKADTSDFVLTAIRDGERDYNDAITTLLRTYPIGTIIIRLWWGADDLPRGSWLHLDDLIVEEPNPAGAAIDLLCVSSLSLLKQALPKFNVLTSQRLPLAYPSGSVPVSSLDKVALDLFANQLGDALPGRWLGPTLPAYQLPVPGPAGGSIVSNTAANPSVVTTQAPHGRTGTFTVTIAGASDTAINGIWTATVVDSTHFSVPVLGAGGTGGTWLYAGGALATVIVAKTIVDSNTNPTPGRSTTADDAKMELDALGYIAGYVHIPSQGRIKAVDCFGPQSVKVVFAPEAIRPITIATGLRQRQAEAFVNWGWDGSKYKGIAYGLNAAALQKLGNAFIDPQPLEDTICQWIQQQSGDAANQSAVANALALRQVNTFGTGLLEWTFESTYAYPELEGGDLVAVPTDWFVANDPNTGAQLYGLIYALAIVKAWEPIGRTFTVWTRRYSDLVAAAQAGTRVGFGSPAVSSITPTLDTSQNLSLAIHCTGAAAVRFAVSASAYPSAGTVGAAALNTLDVNGNFTGTAGLVLGYGQTGYISAIAYENADGSGASSVLFQAQITAPAAPVTSLTSVAAFPRGNHLNVSWAGLSGVASVKIAFSKVSFPAAGTGTAYNGQSGQQDMGAMVYADFAYVTVTPYSGAGATGTQGPAIQVQSQIPYHDLMFDPVTGKVFFTTALNPQGSVPPSATDPTPFSYTSWCIFASGRGGIVWTWSAFNVYLADGSTIAIPASSSQATPAAPTTGTVAGGALAGRTRCVRVAYVKDKMMLGISSEVNQVIGANNLLKVTSPAAAAGYDGWVPLVGSGAGTGDEVTQTSAPVSSPVAFGTDWTEPTTGATQPTGSNSQANDFSGVFKGAHDWNLANLTTYWYYPCWDVANAILGFAGGGGQTAKSNLQASRQNRDGYISLAGSGPISAATPAVGGGGSGSGGGGCLHPDTLVDTPDGPRALHTLRVGDRVRARSGGWTRLLKYETKPQREWVRVRLAQGGELLCTLSHPFTLSSGVKRASELSLGDLAIVPDGFSQIVLLERVTLDGVEQVDVECDPEREFWASAPGTPRLLTHNTFINS